MVSDNFIKGMAITFFVVGVVGAIAIIFSFDFTEYDQVKRTWDDSIKKQANIELLTTIIYAGITFIGSWFLGTVLMALKRIINTLEKDIS